MGQVSEVRTWFSPDFPAGFDCVFYEAAVDCDWQPFALGISADLCRSGLEDEFARTRKAGCEAVSGRSDWRSRYRGVDAWASIRSIEISSPLTGVCAR